MTRALRELLPWERHCGCPTCGAKPRERCVTTRPIHRDLEWLQRMGFTWRPQPTAPHKARYQLWCLLFGHRVCEA